MILKPNLTHDKASITPNTLRVYFGNSTSDFDRSIYRTKNTVNILIKTMVDGLIGAFAYWAVGWAFAYGPSSNGFIGEANFFRYLFESVFDIIKKFGGNLDFLINFNNKNGPS